MSSLDDALAFLADARIVDLGLPLFQGMPSAPVHSPFLFSLAKLHGEVMYADGTSSATDVLAMGTHVGTHIDALGHVSRNGRVAGGREIGPLQERAGLREVGIDAIPPIVRRGVLLDIPRVRGVDRLASTDEVTPEDLSQALVHARTELRPGDVALIRTGWAQLFPDDGFQGHPAPGPGIPAAAWLVDRGVSVAGSDTPAFEQTPARGLAVHVALLVDAGIPIIEQLNLEELAATGESEVLFVALPLRIVGGTASPIRPIAILDQGAE